MSTVISESRDLLFKAFVAAQKKLENPHYDRENSFHKNRYATLASVRNTITKIIGEFGLGVSQHLSLNGGFIECETLVMHESGQSMSSTFSMPVGEKSTPQQHGIVSTYLRRYSLMAMFNIVGEDDSDGEDTPVPSGEVSVAEAREKLSTAIRAAGVAACEKALADKLKQNGMSCIRDLAGFGVVTEMVAMLDIVSKLPTKTKS